MLYRHGLQEIFNNYLVILLGVVCIYIVVVVMASLTRQRTTAGQTAALPTIENLPGNLCPLSVRLLTAIYPIYGKGFFGVGGVK